MIILSTSPARAQQQGVEETASTMQQQPLAITIDMEYKNVRAGEHILYNTLVTNKTAEASAPLCVAMNIINLNAAGDIVDPEDWSPQRTQYIESLAAGQSAHLSWRVNAILDCDYLVYMVVIPEPAGPDATSQPIASPGIHLTVEKYTTLTPGRVLPFAIGGPVGFIVGIVILFRLRRQKNGTGGGCGKIKDE